MSLAPSPSNRFPAPQGIPTAITLPELELLQHYAHEAGTVLEIGTHYGFSCIGMALAGARVMSVDPHTEGPADQPDTWPQFLANVRRHGFDPDRYDPIWPARIAIEDAHFTAERRFGMAFIDGDHVWPAPMRDARIAMAHLEEPYYLAFHDVTPAWPGVLRATDELRAAGAISTPNRVGTLNVYRVIRPDTH